MGIGTLLCAVYLTTREQEEQETQQEHALAA